MARKPEGTEMSVIEQIDALKEQLNQLQEQGKAAAMEKAQEGVNELRKLGFKFVLVEEGNEPEPRTRAPRKATGDTPKRISKGGECPTCHFVTDPHHDARKHRGQSEKRPFTEDELAAMGMKRVS